MANSLMDRMKASQMAAPAAPPAQIPAAQTPVAQAAAPAAPPAQAPVASAAPATSLNPPEAASALERLQMAKAAQAAGAPVAPASAQAPVTQMPLPATPPAPVAPAAQVQATPAVASAQAQTQAPVAALPPEVVPRKFLDLYIDCAPNDGYTEFADVAAPVLAELEQEYGKHYRLIEGLFGGNAALFAKAMGMALDHSGQPMALVVSTASPMARDALEALEIRAVRIVRGF